MVCLCLVKMYGFIFLLCEHWLCPPRQIWMLKFYRQPLQSHFTINGKEVSSPLMLWCRKGAVVCTTALPELTPKWLIYLCRNPFLFQQAAADHISCSPSWAICLKSDIFYLFIYFVFVDSIGAIRWHTGFSCNKLRKLRSSLKDQQFH